MKKSVYAFLVLIGLVVPSSLVTAEQATLVIIANPQIAVETISKRDLADYYLKKKRTWPDGTSVRPFDWTEGQPARVLFLKLVLNKTESELAQYWMGRKFFSGDKAPMSLDSGSTLCSLVSTVRGSIGYILSSSDEYKECSGVKVIGEIR